MKLCPYKFSHYEFEGGQDCIGSECGMFKRCNADYEITAVEFDALDEHAQALERENAELKAKLDQMTVERDILQDCVDDLNADTSELQAKADGYVEALEKLGCSALANGTVFWPSDYGASCSELQKQVDELTAELTAARSAHAQAEHDAETYREKLGRVLDMVQEMERVGTLVDQEGNVVG